MDNIRVLLISALVFVLFLIYQAWQVDYGPKQPAAVATQPATGEVPTPPPPAAAEATQSPAPAPQTAAAAAVPEAELILVETDVLRVEISPRGGTITSVWLKDYPVTPERPENKFRLLKPTAPNLFVAESGLVANLPDAVPAPNALFRASASQYRLADNDQTLVVELTWDGPAGAQVTKRYRFQRGSYLIDVEQEVVNPSSGPLAVRSYAQLQRGRPDESQSERFIYTYTGGAYYSPQDKYQKVSFDQMQKAALERDVTDGWVAMLQHYFVAAWAPPAGQSRHFFTNVVDGARFVIGGYSPAVSLEPQARHTFSERLFVGPKLHGAVVINKKAAEYFGIPEPVGKKVRIWSFRKAYTIVGIMDNIIFESLHRDVRPMGYLLPAALDQTSRPYLLVKTGPGRASSILSYLESAWDGFSPGLPLASSSARRFL